MLACTLFASLCWVAAAQDPFGPDTERAKKIAEIERRCLPAIAWLSRSGVPFDNSAWNRLAEQARVEADRLADRLDAEVPAESGRLLMEGAVNWSSPAQVMQAFERLGITLKRLDKRLTQALKECRERLTAFGIDPLRLD